MKGERYSLLIVAYDASLLQILPLVKHLKNENPLVDIHLLTNNKMDGVTSEIKEYASKVIQLVAYNKFLRNIGRLGAYIYSLLYILQFYILSYRKYDVVNIHFASSRLYRVMPFLKKMSEQIVITPWGSDVLRLEDEKAIYKMQKIYSYATYATCSPDTPLGRMVAQKFMYIPEKMHELRFGVDFFDYVNEIKPEITTETAKLRFGVSGRYTISCGYSTAPSHQHDVFIETINTLKDSLPDNLTLLFPFTYGWGTPEYIQSLKDKCIEYGIHSVYVEDFLDIEALYMLRMATDIYVNIQTTDANAGSVMQYFVCGKKVVHGSWLKYVYLQEFPPTFYFPIANIEELPNGILKACNSDNVKIPEKLREKLLERGWHTQIKKWNDFFMQLSNIK